MNINLISKVVAKQIYYFPTLNDIARKIAEWFRYQMPKNICAPIVHIGNVCDWSWFLVSWLYDTSDNCLTMAMTLCIPMMADKNDDANFQSG